MTFTSFSYFLFVPVVYLSFYFVGVRWRWLVLLTASYVFYASFNAPYLLAVLLMVTGISYACGLRIKAHPDESIRRRWLWIGSFACVAVLALMKYLPFLELKVSRIFGLDGILSSTVISIGVSYFTFQAISYMADVYLEIEEPEYHFGRYALYLAFFPKLLQGPIERAGDLLPQLKHSYQFDYDAMRSGMLLFAWGFFKKVVVADRLALYADQVYNHSHDYTGLSLILGTYAYALQIYYDFSAYTDMARGAGQIFGINLTENFNSPYMAISIADFWRRWHISFSRWILDYIFKPLQMGWRNWGQAGTAAALIITFLVSGIWHGATWGFVVWGLLHGIYLAVSNCYRPYRKRLHKRLGVERSSWLRWWQVFVTFNMVCLAWVFFRASDLGDAWYVVSHAFSGAKGLPELLFSQGHSGLAITLVLLSVMLFASNGRILLLLNQRRLLRWSGYFGLATIIFILKQTSSNFIYFKF